MRNAYFVTCQPVVKDADGRVVELRCTYDLTRVATPGWVAPEGQAPLGAAEHAILAKVRFATSCSRTASEGRELLEDLGPVSETVLTGALPEPSLAGVPVGEAVRFERLCYFYVVKDSRTGAPVFNRTMTLKDNWASTQAPA